MDEQQEKLLQRLEFMKQEMEMKWKVMDAKMQMTMLSTTSGRENYFPTDTKMIERIELDRMKREMELNMMNAKMLSTTSGRENYIIPVIHRKEIQQMKDETDRVQGKKYYHPQEKNDSENI